ncbi:MAG: protein-methionine-sulfoxide reductase heme-binding subunit MsrQ [Paracoccaceae bacterium]
MIDAQQINGTLRRVPAWAIYIVGAVPAFWFLYLGLTGGLGVEPIRALEQELGLFALKLFLVVLAVTPLRNLTGISLFRFRRALGLLVFYYITLHLLVWLFLDVQIWSQILGDILKRPYITIGMAGFLLLIPLAATSNNWSVRKLGALRWRFWHRLTYPAAILGGVHYVMLVKGWQLTPLLYLTAILALLALRIRWNRARVAA